MSVDFNIELEQLFERLAKKSSPLAIRYRDDQKFRERIRQVVQNLGNFYQAKGNEAWPVFKSKLRGWIENLGDDYLGFVGELFVAQRLVSHNIEHRFIPETKEHPTPDFELTIGSRKIYLEVKTLQEDIYMSFAERVERQIEQIPPDLGIVIIPLYIKDEDALVASASKAIEEALNNKDYSTIKHEGYYVKFYERPDPGLPSITSWRSQWTENRKDKKSDLPYLEYKLEETLKKNLGQFNIYTPTFLVWFNFDLSLIDIPIHINNVLERHGPAKFVNVAGVIVDDAYLGWRLFENNQFPDYALLESEGVFNTIQILASRVTVICTVLNEGESVRRLMDSLAAQTRQPDEVVIVDGGSRDDTVAVVNEYAGRLPLRVVVEPGANISQGRNVAAAAAKGDVIASTDAGVRLAPAWLEKLAAPLDADPAVQVVSGFFVPDPQTPFEVAMGATVLPRTHEIDPATFLPSSRSVAFRRAAFEAIGGYPEWLDYCEDLVFDFRLRDRFGTFAWAPEAVAYFRPRGSLRAFFVQYYRYARGDGKADLWHKRHLIRYITYLVALPLILLAGAAVNPLWWLLLVAGVVYMFGRPYRRLASEHPIGVVARAAGWVPIIRVTGDIAKMIGYPVGLWWRWRHNPPPWRTM